MSASPSSSVNAVPAVIVDHVGLSLPGTDSPLAILRDIDLRIEPGETVAIIGRSGSGKSTLLSIIGGLERPSSGEVTIAGTRFGGLDEDGLACFRREHVGIVFQSFHLIQTMTALENVALPLELAGRRDAMQVARASLESVGLGGRLGHYPAQLSGGEQQRVAIARAVVAEPDILLADEPTGNLDAATGQQIMALLFDLQARLGTTLVLVTHDPALAERCTRIVELADGGVIGERKQIPRGGIADLTA
ncbi:MAG TPA: ABC transporter ATP-binding protein [Stellaceae bacterium]|nr:ABC transporter ATP-binding protein [Stellaceae bacterium]